ncbi:esterase [Ectocarpus siliculosus]|uniref:S-formylglutathione hydrolase n=1 Tax=Ectocarpus siliculosus TaxID=2880 RepID=D7FI83_ECTSI|nr:esterase [Ectocarpus siliculosus]|eukprot:CBJ28708.1 esterase [Ectocarpus siliculosus]
MASSSGGAAADLEIKSETACFGGRLLKCVHQSKATKTQMTFTVFLPPAAASSAVPVLYYLSGLTCTDDNFIQKAGAQRIAALRGVALVAPDTSPRGAGVAGEDEGWDFGTGAGFYVDATEAGWKENYRMYAYVTEELPAAVAASFPAVDTSKASVCGHSMGGHGALVVAFRNPDKYRSVSAFSAICNPVECPWGKKAFSGYLGKDEAAWKEYDATELMRRDGPFPSLGKILLDQGSADNFLTAGQLIPEALVKACEDKGQPCEMRMQDGYDHSYFFISSFIEDHVSMHADRLLA